MKGRVLCLDRIGGRAAAALIGNGRVEDLLVTPPPDAGLAPETILWGIADRPMKGIGGTTVRLPGGASGFLRRDEVVRPGRPVLVQVTGWADSAKPVPLTTRILIKGRHGIATPGRPGLNLSRRIRDEAERARLGALAEAAGLPADTGLILRTHAAGADSAEIAADLTRLRDLTEALARETAPAAPRIVLAAPDAHALARREWPDADEASGGFAAHGVLEAIDGFLDPTVRLPDGAWATIEPTRAFVAIDVNTGADLSPAAGLKANLALARDLPRQLRCRGLGGQVVIDAAPCPKARRQLVEQEFTRAFASDPVETAFVGWTALGHIELRRKRERLPITALIAPEAG